MRCRVFLLGAAALGLAIAGCDDIRRHAAGEGIRLGEAQAPLGPDASPDAVAMATLDAIREAQESRAQGLGSPEAKEKYESAMQTLRSLAASSEIHERVRKSGSNAVPKDITEAGSVTLTIEAWIASVARYVNGYDLNSMVTSIVSPDQYANTYMNAENPRDREVLDAVRADDALSDEEVRSMALSKGVCPPITAGIELRLKKTPAGWRVMKVGAGPPRQPSPPMPPPVSTPTAPPTAQ